MDNGDFLYYNMGKIGEGKTDDPWFKGRSDDGERSLYR